MTLRHPYIVRRTGVLEPEDHAARAHLASIPIGERVLVTIKRDRLPQFADLVYATLRLVAAAMGLRDRTARGWLAIRTGRADVVHWPSSRTVIVAHGTGPSDMNNVELEAFWDDARAVIVEEVLPYVDHEAREQISFRLDQNIVAPARSRR